MQSVEGFFLCAAADCKTHGRDFRGDLNRRTDLLQINDDSERSVDNLRFTLLLAPGMSAFERR